MKYKFLKRTLKRYLIDNLFYPTDEYFNANNDIYF